VLDKALFRPVAFGFKAVVPKPARSGIRNVLSNLTEPIVFLNDLLQLKPGRAVKTLGRFAINTTAGVGGLFDPAKTAKLPHRANGFGNTLGRYGIGPGPYLFIPLAGPGDFRDLLGGQADRIVLPLAIKHPFNSFKYQIAEGAFTGLDLRIESDADLKVLLGGAADPYATLRSVYLQNRAAEVRAVRGQTDSTGGALDDPLADPEAVPENAPTAPSESSPAPAKDEPSVPALPPS
jgi:phospholipid-binding lipoprotein MlaA